MSDTSDGSTGSAGPPAPQDPMTHPDPWNAVAAAYDEHFFQQLPGFADRAIALVAPTGTDTVLDLATGPGTLAIRLAPQVARVVAVDFAEKMIDQLRVHIDRLRLGNVEARVMDGHALTFADQSFDIVASMFGWFMFADRDRALREIHRVLRPGGRLLVTSWLPFDRNLLLGAAFMALREALPDLPRPAAPLPTQVPEVVASELRAAGFTSVATEIVTASVAMNSAEEYWNMTQRGGAPLVVLKKKLGVETWQKVSEATLAALRARFGSGSFTLEAAAIFASGVR